MPKFMMAISVGIFLVAASLGFGFGKGFKTLAAQSTPPVTPAGQVNIILVRIDDRTQAQPRLIAVWGIFIDRSSFPSLIMKHIYPEPGSDESLNIGKAFSLTADKRPSSGFAQSLARLDVPSAHIMIIDDYMLPDWISALSEPSILKSSVLPIPGINIYLARQLDLELFTNVCAAIENRSHPTTLGTIDASGRLILSDTLKSSDDLQQWKGLVTSLHFASCVALVGP
jgi:hypothetical protein